MADSKWNLTVEHTNGILEAKATGLSRYTSTLCIDGRSEPEHQKERLHRMLLNAFNAGVEFQKRTFREALSANTPDPTYHYG